MSLNLRDLALRNDNDNGVPASLKPPRRRWLSRYLLPGAIVLGFLLVLGWSLRALLLPARSVTVMPVLTSRQVSHVEGTPLFQAAAWVEPRPQAIAVAALSEGVVSRLHVVENSPVKKGDLIAELIVEDADLAVKAAEAEVRLRQAEVAGAKGGWEAAKTNLEQPVHLRAALAETEAMLAQKESEQAVLPFQKSVAETKARVTGIIFENQKGARGSGALSETQFQTAKADFESAQAVLDEVKTRLARVDSEVKALAAKRSALALRLELKADEKKAEAETRAAFDAAKARLELADNALATAELRRARMKVYAPCDGRVLNLVARPGSRLMGLDPKGMQESTTVVTLYQPHSLQVRADVRLEDAARVQPGQKAQIVSPTGVTLKGTVLFMTSQADVQKNTIQVKVGVDDPPDVLRPEMLVQVTFLAPAAAGKTETTETVRILAPRSLIVEEGAAKGVWIADETGVARKKTVRLGATLGELVEISAGLQVGDRLIVAGREDLSEGARIRVTGEDTTLNRGDR
ncbi:MAG: efflux RND transporter periplasmic adaptor subunit [Gemmataceae bacterium]